VSAKANAGFDALFITDALSAFADGAGIVELHLFAYLACLLSIYDGRDVSSWDYDFVATPAGAPYADALASECDRLRAMGLLVDHGLLLRLGPQAHDDLTVIREFASARARIPYLDAACSAATLLPLPTVTNAISHEPGLQQALSQHGSKELLNQAELMLVDAQFRAVSEALTEHSGEHSDLLVPTTLWLSYINATAHTVAA
jgi:hypothetical protein